MFQLLASTLLLSDVLAGSVWAPYSVEVFPNDSGSQGPWYQGHPRCSGHEPLEFSGSVGSCMKRYYPGPNVYIYAKLEESATPGFLDLSYPCNEECKSCPMGVAIPISLDGDCGRMNTTIHYPIEEFFVVDARLSKDPFFKIFYL